MAIKANLIIFAVGALIIIFLLLPNERYRDSISVIESNVDKHHSKSKQGIRSNSKVRRYKIAIISDLDENSKDSQPHTWYSHLRYGHLKLSNNDEVSMQWDTSSSVIKSQLSEKGRGMELSGLILYHDHLCALDDRSGVIFKIIKNKAVPWIILADGDGNVAKGFKSEWATIKDSHLIVGGSGKEWTTKTGQVLNLNPQYIKRINKDGGVTHINWVHEYERVKAAIGIRSPGYVIHEAIVWSDIHRRWFFLPRRASHHTYDDIEDEHRGTNILVSCTERVNSCKVVRIGKLNPLLGYSAFRFIPDTGDKLIIALKTMENKGKIATFVTVFNITGSVILQDVKVDDKKFEGLEFIPDKFH